MGSKEAQEELRREQVLYPIKEVQLLIRDARNEVREIKLVRSILRDMRIDIELWIMNYSKSLFENYERRFV